MMCLNKRQPASRHRHGKTTTITTATAIHGERFEFAASTLRSVFTVCVCCRSALQCWHTPARPSALMTFMQIQDGGQLLSSILRPKATSASAAAAATSIYPSFTCSRSHRRMDKHHQIAINVVVVVRVWVSQSTLCMCPTATLLSPLSHSRRTYALTQFSGDDDANDGVGDDARTHLPTVK